MGRPALDAGEQNARLQWKTLLRERIAQTEGPPSAQELASDVIFILNNRFKVEAVPQETRLIADINFWRSRPGQGKRRDFRYPNDESVRNALVNALNWRPPWKGETFREVHEDLKPLLRGAQFRFAAPRNEHKIPLLQQWMKNDVLVVSMVAQRFSEMEVVKDKPSRQMFMEFIEDMPDRPGGKFLSVSMATRPSSAKAETPELPEVFRGYVVALAKAMKERGDQSPEALSILGSFKRNVRFMCLPWSDHYYGFCRPRLREMLGFRAELGRSGLGQRWYELESLLGANSIVLEQLDGLDFKESESGGVAGGREIFFGKVAESEDQVLKWFSKLRSHFPQDLHIFSLTDEVHEFRILRERLATMTKIFDEENNDHPNT